MKIYINEKINLSKLSNLLKEKKLDKYLENKSNILKIYSKEGIYEINENNTLKWKITEGDIENKKINDIDCLIDYTQIKKEDVCQIPFEHITIPLSILTYSLNEKSHFKLIIECIQIKNNNENLKPINFYFQINEKINNQIINFMQDSSVFLSMLK